MRSEGEQKVGREAGNGRLPLVGEAGLILAGSGLAAGLNASQPMQHKRKPTFAPLSANSIWEERTLPRGRDEDAVAAQVPFSRCSRRSTPSELRFRTCRHTKGCWRQVMHTYRRGTPARLGPRWSSTPPGSRRFSPARISAPPPPRSRDSHSRCSFPGAQMLNKVSTHQSSNKSGGKVGGGPELDQRLHVGQGRVKALPAGDVVDHQNAVHPVGELQQIAKKGKYSPRRQAAGFPRRGSAAGGSCPPAPGPS